MTGLNLNQKGGEAMTSSLKETPTEMFFKYLLAFCGLVFIGLVLIAYGIGNWFTRRQKNVPMDTYPHL